MPIAESQGGDGMEESQEPFYMRNNFGSMEVQILSAWSQNQVFLEEPFQFHMILKHQSGEGVHAILSRQQYKSHKRKLMEKNTVIIRGFLVSIFYSKFRTIPGNLLLCFTDDTSVTVVSEEPQTAIEQLNSVLKDISGYVLRGKRDKQGDKQRDDIKELKNVTRYPYFLNKIPDESDDAVEMKEFVRAQKEQLDFVCFYMYEDTTGDSIKRLEYMKKQEHELLRFKEYQALEKDWNGLTFDEFVGDTVKDKGEPRDAKRRVKDEGEPRDAKRTNNSDKEVKEENAFGSNPFIVYSDFTAESRFPINRVGLAEKALSAMKKSKLGTISTNELVDVRSEKGRGQMSRIGCTDKRRKRKKSIRGKRGKDADQELLKYINSSFHKVNGTLEREEIRLRSEENFLDAVIQTTYPEIQDNMNNPQYLKERLIVTHTRHIVSEINALIISRIPGTAHTYLSRDTNNDISEDNYNTCDCYSEQMAPNKMEIDALPNHKIDLKIGVPVMLLRDMQEEKLQRGTRLMVTGLEVTSVEAQVLCGKYKGKRVNLKRVETTTINAASGGLVVRRSQFPINPCYACLLNQSRSQSLNCIGLYVEDNIMCPGKFMQCILNANKDERMRMILIMNKDSEDYYTKIVLTEEICDNMPLIDRIIQDISNTIQDGN